MSSMEDVLLSFRLYKLLDRIGVTEKVRRLYINNAQAMRQLDKLYREQTSEHVSYNVFGSFIEGTTTPGLHSDIDIMLIDERLPFAQEIIDKKDTECLIMLQACPGYVKLQLPKHLLQEKESSNKYSRLDKIKTEDRFITNKIESGEIMGPILEKNPATQKNGPAKTLNGREILNYDHDFVEAIRSTSWPSFSDEWLKRDRHYGWPTKETISEFEKQGCFCVPVGHPHSTLTHLEWRLSFSLQERQLMFDLNDVQYKCYVLLKLVKNDLIKARIGKALTSYHCKTSLFYTIENNPLNIWKPENLVHCFLTCLKLLHSWCETGFCPNYFIPQENMFEGKVEGERRVQLKCVLKEIMSNCSQCLQQIECDNLGEMLQLSNSSEELRPIETKADNALGEHIFKLYDFYIRCLLCNKNRFFDRITQQKSISAIVDSHFQYIRSLNYHQSNQARECVKRVILYIHTSLASHLAISAIQCKDSYLADWYICASAVHFIFGMNSDVMSSRLKLATVLYMMGHKDSCEFELSKLEPLMSDNVHTVCTARYTGKFLKASQTLLENEFQLKRGEVLETTIQDFHNKHVSSCVIFLPTEIAITPDLLGSELFKWTGTPTGVKESKSVYIFDNHWYNWAVVDAKVYYYFLKHLLKENETGPLDKILDISMEYCPHPETTLPIIRYMYTRLFVKSGEIVNTDVHDSVRCRLAVLLYRLRQSGRLPHSSKRLLSKL